MPMSSDPLQSVALTAMARVATDFETDARVPMNPHPDVIVIGAGIIGATCAWRLSQAGLKVTVLERSATGSEASQAALGVLTFHARPQFPEPLLVLCRHSREYYPSVIDELAEVTGERVDYREAGQLMVAPFDADLPELEEAERANRELGLEVERASPEEVRLLEPHLNPDLASALYYPGDAWVDNTALTFAIVKAAQSAGARIERANVTSIEMGNGRAGGVQAGGETYQSEWIVLAAGCWSGQIPGVPDLPVVPRRGQAFAVEGALIRRVVHSPRAYMVPKGDIQTMLGATVEDVGFDTANTLGGLRDIASKSLEMSAKLESCTFDGAWAGLRPGTPDEIPVIGPFEQIPNLIVASGHFRNGILLAPLTARLVRDHLTGSDPVPDLAPFSPNRAALRRA